MPTSADIELAAARAAACQAVNAERSRRIAAGLTYPFPDGAGPLDLRDEADFRNLQGLATRAQMLAAQGVSDPVIRFRDDRGADHWLTPAQMLDLASAVFARTEAVYARAWQLKDAIAAAETAAAVAAIDVTADWPA